MSVEKDQRYGRNQEKNLIPVEKDQRYGRNQENKSYTRRELQTIREKSRKQIARP